MGNLLLAFQAFFGLLFTGRLPEAVLTKLQLVPRSLAKPGASKGEASAIKPADGALQLLALLQRDARLVDFLMEDLSRYSDEQVGSAARTVQESSRKTLQQYVKLAPAIDGVEGAYTRITDLRLVKLVGNVPPDGQSPGGLLRHRGWRVEAVSLPKLAPQADVTLLAPAEVEIE